MDELERHAVHPAPRQRAVLVAVHLGIFDELDAASAQRGDGGRYVGCTQADALQHLFALDVDEVRHGFHQLHVEAPARAGEDLAARHDAEALIVRQFGEAEELAIELAPVVHSVHVDVLHDAEPVQPGHGRRVLVDLGDRHEIDAPDRELPVAVDEVDAAAADAVDGGDVELHHLDMRRHGPGAALERARAGRRRVADAQGDGGDDRCLGRHDAARAGGVVGVDDDVHRALAVQQHLPRSVPRDGAEAHHLEHPPEGLRARGGVLDEFDAVQAQRVARMGLDLAVDRLGHGDSGKVGTAAASPGPVARSVPRTCGPDVGHRGRQFTGLRVVAAARDLRPASEAAPSPWGDRPPASCRRSARPAGPPAAARARR